VHRPQESLSHLSLRRHCCRLATPPDFQQLDLDVSQEELATIANVARTTAGVILRGLKKASYAERFLSLHQDSFTRRAPRGAGLNTVAPGLAGEMMERTWHL
jgi:hypothetical protein